MLYREQLECLEEITLAPYAVKSKDSCKRVHEEEEHPLRTAFQRDRDRIIHSLAFRRLEYKTQVFVNYEGDHYRTRLTHTIEVMHVANTLSRLLRLNPDLTEAIAYAHDLGHTPFGHAGEKILDKLMRNHGGFEHNRQSLRVVDSLEKNYPGFSGLNLTKYTRDGIMKHRSEHDKPKIDNLDLSPNTSLEGQVVNIADEIAYICHDLEDGLRSGILNLKEVETLELWNKASKDANKHGIGKNFGKFQFQIIRFLKNLLVTDCAEASLKLLEKENVDSVDKVRNWKKSFIGFHEDVEKGCAEINAFLMENFYQNYRIVRMASKAEEFITKLFERYVKRPEILPPGVQKQVNTIKKSNNKKKVDEEYSVFRTVCDYIAGMTDRFALEEYEKLFNPSKRV